jgi:hypothetical protein
MGIDKTNKDVRCLNRTFSLGEYKESWTKLERYLFIEIYNVLNNFSSISAANITTFSAESILLTLPVNEFSCG